MTPLKIGLLGCGHMGRVVHLNNLSRMPEIEVAALAEPDPDLRRLAQTEAPQAAAYSSWEELLEKADLNAVVISLPNAFHAAAASAAFRRGLHVYLEKPLAIDLATGRSLLQVWRESGKLGMIGFNYRFNPLHQEVRRKIREKNHGEWIGVRSVFTAAGTRTPQWKQTRANGGGVLLDLASHHVDTFRYWFDEPIVEVTARVRSVRFENDSAALELRLESGLTTQSFFSLSSVNEDRFEIYGTTEKVSFDRYRSWSVDVTPADGEPSQFNEVRKAARWFLRNRFGIRKILTRGNEPSFGAALECFVDSVLRNNPISPDLNDGLESLAVIIAAEESGRLGHPVRLPLVTA